MAFEWPMVLWLLLAVPGLVAAYLWLKRRRKKLALRFASLSVVREALGRSPGWRRHVPPVLLLVALTALIVAAARPGARITLPSDHRTIVLAIRVTRRSRIEGGAERRTARCTPESSMTVHSAVYSPARAATS